MNARVMVSSVVNDTVPLGRLSALSEFWFDVDGVGKRLKKASYPLTPKSKVDFSFIRQELGRHLQGKYGFEPYIFEDTPGLGLSPDKETVSEALNSHLVIGIFGSKTGWKVGDQDPLTPTLREWRAALQSPLKFKVFWLKGSVAPQDLPGELGVVMSAVSDYKEGKIYLEFSNMVELFAKVDRNIRDYISRAIVRYATDTVAREPTSETERWLLSPYRARQKGMKLAFEKVAASLGIGAGKLSLGDHEQPVSLQCVPDSFSIPESRKFVAYVFDDEAEGRKAKELGAVHFVAIFGGVTDLQIRRHIGNLEEVKVYSASWGFYASEPSTGIQCVYLPKCTNSLRMHSVLSQAVAWLGNQAREVGEFAKLRSRILDLLAK